MAKGLTDRVWTLEEMIAIIDERCRRRRSRSLGKLTRHDLPYYVCKLGRVPWSANACRHPP